MRGARLTDRDRLLLAYVSMARYASASQLQRLVAQGCDRSVVYRRLRRLCARGNRPGEDACLRRLEYRRAQGTAVPVWALTPFGHSVIGAQVPYQQPLPSADVGHQFLEHTLWLNDVLLGLVLTFRPRDLAALAALPFRWLSEGDESLTFQTFDRRNGVTATAVLKPDAMLELPSRGRRLFLEAETGAHSITTADPSRHGAVLAKAQRYATFFTASTEAEAKRTWYERAFSDGLFPELVFLVHSDGRREKVEQAIAKWRGSGGGERFAVRVLAQEGAAEVLASLLASQETRFTGVVQESPPAGWPRVVTLDEAKARRLRAGYNALAAALGAVRQAVARHNASCATPVALPPPPLGELRDLRDLIQRDLLGEGSTPLGRADLIY